VVDRRRRRLDWAPLTVVFVLYLLLPQANYRAGLRILEIVDPSKAMMVERAFFDVFPEDNTNQFNGAWSTYPYLPSGIILVSGIEQGLFVLRWNRDGVSTQPNTECLSTNAPVVAPTPAPTVVPPNNNKCAGAIPVAVGSTTRGSTVAATTGSLVEAGVYCGTTINTPGVWYQLPGQTGRMTVSTCSSADYDSKISVYEGSACNRLRCIDGDDDGCGGFSAPSTVTWDAKVGTTYYIFVHGSDSAVGSFALSVSLQLPPANDQCEGAITIASTSGGGGRFSGSTELATSEESVRPCGTEITSLGKGVWYSLSGVKGTVKLNMCGLNVNYDSQVSIYKGSDCRSLTCIDGDDDGCGGFQAPSLIEFTADTVDSVYKIYIHGVGSEVGQFEFDIDFDPNNNNGGGGGDCNFGLGIICFFIQMLLNILDFVTFWD
jgi:hypothetical protein